MAADKWLIVGLGNPGPAYSHNRHNVGYWCVNRLARLHGISLKARRLAAFGEGSIRGTPVLLAKPRTFVNRSGQAVASLLRNFKIKRQNMLVVCDDLDLTVGSLRLKPSGGHGGQKGLRSVIGAAGGDDFPRLRIGIGRPLVDGRPSWDPEAIAAYVLSDPTPDEAKALQAAAVKGTEAVETVLREGIEAAMNRYNR
ncbi:MAG: aminoacyl-tRNA hydrolase [Chloroflexi bacterium]|nr:aminoacyl-tRNA hydrolase [Chloroflexota bacterium]